MKSNLAVFLLILALPSAQAADEWQFSGDARGGYFNVERTAPAGAESESDEFKLRLRLAAQRKFGDSLTFRARIAGLYSSEQDESQVYLRGYPSSAAGITPGDTTLDEAYLLYAPVGGDWTLRIGRMQTKFELPGVAAKGLDRNDSPNVDVNWTDGLHLTQTSWLAGWKTHLILQHNHEKGASVVTRGPMDFSESGSRVSLFAGIDATDNPGPIIQRVLGFTFMPKALATEGITQAIRDDYLTLDAKLSAAWPLSDAGMRLVAGIEAAYAFNTPDEAVVVSGGSGEADGLGWQLAGSIHDFSPGHNIGAVIGRVGAGWLLSPDFRNNDELYEVRYQWKFSKRWSMEARYRIREEIVAAAATGESRVDQDYYIRISGSF